MRAHAGAMHVGGPLEDANGMMIGAIFLIDVEDRV
jgi:hypothetical protein